MESKFNRHVTLGEQNIDKKVMGNITIQGELKYPSLEIKTEDTIGVYTLNAFRNSLDLKQGDTYLYMRLGGVLRCLGKLSLTIDNVYKINNILLRLKPSLEYTETPEDKPSLITVDDLIGTIKL